MGSDANTSVEMGSFVNTFKQVNIFAINLKKSVFDVIFSKPNPTVKPTKILSRLASLG